MDEARSRGLHLKAAGAAAGKLDADSDDPDEAGKAREGDQKEQLRKNEMQRAELAGRGEGETQNDNPFGKQVSEAAGDGDARYEKSHGNGEAGTAECIREIVEAEQDWLAGGD